VDSVAARKRWYSRTLPTKDERHRLVTKYRFLGFDSLGSTEAPAWSHALRHRVLGRCRRRHRLHVPAHELVRERRLDVLRSPRSPSARLLCAQAGRPVRFRRRVPKPGPDAHRRGSSLSDTRTRLRQLTPPRSLVTIHDLSARLARAMTLHAICAGAESLSS
jgi:hypothetical protein